MVVVTQTKLAVTTSADTPNDNISLPHGIIRTVRHYLDFVGMLDYLRTLKVRGIRLDELIIALCVFSMYATNSMAACAKWLEDPKVRRQFKFPAGSKVDQATLNRALAILGRNREGVIATLWKGIQERFEIDDYDINLDGSAVVLYGPKCELGAKGYGRDKNRGKLQVEFMVAQLAALGIPIYVKPYKGNVSDEEQYADSVPEIAGLLSGKGIHALDDLKCDLRDDENPLERDDATMEAIAAVAMLGAAIVADNGGASKDNIDRIRACGFEYVTRVKMNASDDKRIMEHASEFEYVEEGVLCLTHRFKDSGRTTYLFLSRDLLVRGGHKARNRFEKDLETLEDLRKGILRKSDFVKVRNVPWVNVDVRLTAQETLIPLDGMDRERMVRDRMGPRCGFFKLQTDRQMTAYEALQLYRRRAGVEHVISSFKRITGIKPMRVWNKDSVSGAMTLTLLAEAAIAMARYCMKGERVETKGKDGSVKVRVVKPSTESIVRSLSHLTVTRFRKGKGRFEEVTSNWEPISTEIMGTILLHESPEWGSNKVPVRA